jgi:hypothetical protein
VIRGYLRIDGSRARPFLLARLSIPAQRITGEVHFLVDTGADGTLLAPADAFLLGINIAALPPGPPSIGVGGRVPTVYAQANITLDTLTQTLPLRILAPRARPQRAAIAHIPSLLGRDVLADFALFFEERTSRVLLLTSEEAVLLFDVQGPSKKNTGPGWSSNLGRRPCFGRGSWVHVWSPDFRGTVH